MAATVTIAELRNMQIEDLLKEIREQGDLVAKLRLGLRLQKDKDSAKYQRAKKQYAIMKTVLTEKVIEAEQQAASGSSESSGSSPKKKSTAKQSPKQS